MLSHGVVNIVPFTASYTLLETYSAEKSPISPATDIRQISATHSILCALKIEGPEWHQ